MDDSRAQIGAGDLQRQLAEFASMVEGSVSVWQAKQDLCDFLLQTASQKLESHAAVWELDPHRRLTLSGSKAPQGIDDLNFASLSAALPLQESLRNSQLISIEVTHPGGEKGTALFIPLTSQAGTLGLLGLFSVGIWPLNEDGIEPALQRLRDAIKKCFDSLHQMSYAVDYRQLFRSFESLALNLHDASSLSKLAPRLVNSVRDFARVDRVSLVVNRSGFRRLEAVSGVTKPDRRSETAARLKKLSQRVFRTRQPLVFDGQSAEQPSSLPSDLLSYVQTSGARYIEFLPVAHLGTPPRQASHQRGDKLSAVLVLERFDSHLPHPNLTYFRQTFVSQVALSIDRAMMYDRIPFKSFWMFVGSMRRHLTSGLVARTLIALMVISGLIGSLTYVEYPRRINAAGQIVAQSTARLYAPRNAQVKQMLVTTGQAVQQGELLIELEDTSLVADISRLRDQLLQQLTSIELLEGEILSSDPSKRSERIQQQADLRKAKLQAESINSEITLLQREQEKLKIYAPKDGVVIDFDVAQRLAGKPVQLGEQLLQICDINGSKDLELLIAEKDIGYLLDLQTSEASVSQITPVEVEFHLPSLPTEKHSALLTQLPTTSIIDQDGQRYLKCKITLPEESRQLRIGAQADAQLIAKREPLWSLFFGEFMNQFRLYRFSI